MTQERIFTEQEVDRLNEYMDPTFWDDWHSLDSLGRMQIPKKPRLDRALWRISPQLHALSPYGTDYVEKIRLDLIEAFDLLLKKNQRPSRDQIYNLLDLYEEAIDTAYLQLSEAEAIPLVAMILGAASIKPIGLTIQATKVRKALLDLDSLISQAQALKIEAQIQQALGLVTNAITLLVPGLGLLAKGALTIGDLVLDDKLGPDKSSLKDSLSNTAKLLGLTMDGIEKVKQVGSTTKKVASKTGKVLTVTGFFFDWDEVRTAEKLIQEIEKAMKEAKKLYDELVVQMDAEYKRLRDLNREFKQRLEPLRQQIIKQRAVRDQKVRDLQFPLYQPFRWKMELQTSALSNH